MVAPEPYRAERPAARLAPIGGAIRWVFGFVAVAMLLGVLGGVGLMVGASLHRNQYGVADENMMLAGVVALCTGVLLMYVQLGVAVAWMHKVWSWLPDELRFAKNWTGPITPAKAAFFLLIPYFHWYWMFVVNLGLCDALDRMRVQHPASAPPRGVAMAAMISQLAQMPGREQILAGAVGAIQAPLTSFVGTLNGVLTKFVGTVDAIAEKKKAAGGA